MTSHAGPLIPHVVVDSAAFIKRARLETFGSNVYTSPQVIAEIRDSQTRAALKCLAYPLQIQMPTKESIQIVKEVAKKTGDNSVISQTDVEVIALTYELHKRHVGEPVPKPVVSCLIDSRVISARVPLPDNLGSIAHARPPSSSDDSNDESDSISDDDDKDSDNDDDDQEQEKEKAKETRKSEDEDFVPAADDWISEENFDQKAASNFGLGNSFMSEQSEQITDPETGRLVSPPPPVVACLTTDFAMQNVIFHLGLDLITLNGMRITRPRTHLLWCGSCFRPTKRTDTYFCPFCAQANLRRIPVTLHPDGHLQFHFARRFTKSLRGLQQPIRRPRGGKHADEPIYCPDQRLPDRRPAKPKNAHVLPIATNGLLEFEDTDLAGALHGVMGLGLDDSAFAVFPLHDVTSRSARLGIRSDHQVAPRSRLRPTAEHGLKPTRGTAHLPKQRTGNKKKRRNTHIH
ncbi:RNA-binding protein NOB1 [Fasciola gigantica]|uniref:RNA-binding protein NOB1 n=1 Tax=Fasciola gigantica TaxID=46835 RepID=A0A504ZF27_FASGI|nr:RNA-binding protein NOB1 [Fasciola gigantica]